MIQTYTPRNSINKIRHHGTSGHYLMSVDQDIKIWDIRIGKLLYTVFGHEGSINDCVFSPTGDKFASAGEEGYCIYWESNLLPKSKPNPKKVSAHNRT